MKRVAFPVVTAVIIIFCVSVVQAASINITYNIDTDVNRTPISPYVYGGNGQAGSHYTIHRSGGNRLTAYNWENNYSNAGADWWWNNDTYLPWNAGIPWEDWLIPGIVVTDFRDSCISNNQDSIVTLQMAGYVSADDDGYVDCNTEAAPSSRFKEVVFAKGAPFCSPPGSPVTTDAYVYMDEFVNFLVSEYGYANQSNGVKFYALDNEPALWYQDDTSPPITHATHWEVHPYRPTCVEVRDKGIALATAVKNVDPYAQILGPVLYGFAAYLSFQSAPDWGSEGSGYDWFITYYLYKMKQAGISAGKRLLDVLDVHWYPEAYDGPPFTYNNGTSKRITDSSVNTRAMYEARMQAPRTLWDTDYVGTNGENSWINEWNSSYLPILPKLKSSINTYYPDTNLAFTEYDYGGKDHYSGGIAIADVLGIFGKYGVYIANYWGEIGTYLDAAFKIYRNYDGSGSSFGDTEVYSTMSNKVDSSIYASVFNESACELHLIVINKNIDNAISGTFNINSSRNFVSGRVWKFSNTSSSITETTSISSITDNSFTYTIPKTTVCHIVLQADPPIWDLFGGDCHVNIYDLDVFVDDWLDDVDFLDFEDFASFGLEWGL